MIVQKNSNKIDNWFIKGKSYYVLEIIINPNLFIQYRLISEDLNTPVIIDGDLFDILDSKIPNNWQVNQLETCVEILPENIHMYEDNFWQDYFDSTPEIESSCRKILEKEILEIENFHKSFSPIP